MSSEPTDNPEFPVPAANRQVCATDAETPTRTAPQPTGPQPLRRSDQILFGVACVAALVAMTAYCTKLSHWGAEPIELERLPEHVLDFKIELNSATWVEWTQLPGIGPVLAHRIVDEREERGPYRNIDELRRVKGIGPKRLDAMRPFIQDDSEDSAASDATPPRR